ncbi:MAG: hypothetical protein JWM80_2371 [Cyanobacteria bacterium RYN_339]|nr:hypothetical protein [Cyanobacteria bacterium RYN_339]
MKKLLVVLALVLGGCGTHVAPAMPVVAAGPHVQATNAEARAAIARALTFHHRQLLIVGSRDTDSTPGTITVAPAGTGVTFQAEQRLVVVLHDLSGVHTSHETVARTGRWSAATGVALDPEN